MVQCDITHIARIASFLVIAACQRERETGARSASLQPTASGCYLLKLGPAIDSQGDQVVAIPLAFQLRIDTLVSGVVQGRPDSLVPLIPGAGRWGGVADSV